MKRKTLSNLLHSLGLILALGALLLSPRAAVDVQGATPEGLVFWNKLGSEEEVLNSEVGPDIQLTSYKYVDWQEAQIVPAKFGDGLFVNHDIHEGWQNDGGNFFAINIGQTALTPEHGTIEFWFKFKYDAGVHNHAYFFIVRNALTNHFPDSNYNTDLTIFAGWNGWDYGTYGKRFFLYMCPKNASPIRVFTPNYSAAPGGHLAFVDGTLMHFAFVWDVNGIGGSADTLRIYVNGNKEAASTETWSLADGFDPYLYIGSAPNYSPSWDHYYNAVKGVTDNLMIWNYAKTDFSDRFIEDPTAITLVSFTAQAGADGVSLAWETGTEIDNAGFNLYRALLEDGPYTKINDALIAAQGDPVSGASYSFLDTPDYGTFYYQLEDVDYYGVSTLHGPVKVTVARPARRPLYRPTLPEF